MIHGNTEEIAVEQELRLFLILLTVHVAISYDEVLR